MRRILPVLILVIAAAAALPALWRVSAAPKEPELLKLTGDVEGVHDPVIIKDKDTYYVFCTGRRQGVGVIPIRTSKDLHEWKNGGAVFEKLPEWTTKEVPKSRGDAWAPDISYFNGKFHLYYAVSSFGRNGSAIGLATNTTLDSSSPGYKWVDEGMIVRSEDSKDDWNAIDPNLVIESKDRAWLNWGSFWSGIKMRRIDPETGTLSTKDTTLYSLAGRPRTNPADLTRAGDGSIEAPFIIRHGGYWYLFVSFDHCCRGAKSDYKVVVGRAKKVTGPYVDKSGKPMMEGGGTLVVEAATANWHGAGHEGVLQDKGGDYLVFHAYSASTGRPFLQISTMVWRDGWPVVAPMP